MSCFTLRISVEPVLRQGPPMGYQPESPHSVRRCEHHTMRCWPWQRTSAHISAHRTRCALCAPWYAAATAPHSPKLGIIGINSWRMLEDVGGVFLQLLAVLFRILDASEDSKTQDVKIELPASPLTLHSATSRWPSKRHEATVEPGQQSFLTVINITMSTMSTMSTM